jgi:transposase-like protein
MFRPPHCPNPACVAHDQPEGRFFTKAGSFKPKCRPWPVPRFLCKHCGKSFSRQTFRADYRDHRPDLNADVVSWLASGCGLRQTARELGIWRRNLELKARKIARHLWELHENLSDEFRGDVVFQLDEMETFEGCRSTRPLTLPVLIEQESMFIVDARCAPIRPSGKMTPKRRAAIAREEARRGRRPNRSNECVGKVLAAAARRCAEAESITFCTDRKRTYPRLIREAFAGQRPTHLRVSSKRPRDTSNPLFRINLMNAIARDLCGRLRRRSWLVSKEGRYLELQLGILIAYRNYHRPRFNKDTDTPAMLVGFVPDRLSRTALLSWRQDRGPDHSLHPLSHWFETVSEFRRRTSIA